MMKWMHCLHLIAPYAVLSNLTALFLECVHYRPNWKEKGVVGNPLRPSLIYQNKQQPLSFEWA